MKPRPVAVPCGAFFCCVRNGPGEGDCWKPRQFWLFVCFFLRCADSALIVLAVRGSYSLKLADASAVSIQKRKTKLDGKTKEKIQHWFAQGRQDRHAKETRGQMLR